MQSLEQLEANLWLAERAQRRHPSEENKAKVEALKAEIAKQTQSEELATPATSTDAQAETPAETKPTEEAQLPQAPATPADTQAGTPAEAKPTEQAPPPQAPATPADAQAENPVNTKPQKETKPKANAKKKEE